MALSNYDSYALDHEGHSTSGEFVSPLGVTVEIYKNWIYIHDEKAWEEKGTYSRPVVMEVQEGNLRYKDLDIFAIRGPQNGIFVAVHTGYNDKAKGMIGCGVYGYEGMEFVGVTEETLSWFRKEVASDKYGYEVPMNLRWALVFAKGARYNQGDAYFANELGFDIPATKPGEAEGTILSKIIPQIE